MPYLTTDNSTKYRIKNKRFDCGSKIGFLQANISFALNRKDLSSDLRNWLKTII